MSIGRQSRIELAGNDACQDLVACMLVASLGNMGSAKILVVGAGCTAQEIIAMARLEPGWRFNAVDPSGPMLETAKHQLAVNNVLERTDVHLGHVEDLAADESCDAATLIGVLHHLDGDDAKGEILRSIRARLLSGAALIVAGNQYAYTSQPLLLVAWVQRWRQHGASPDEVKVKLGKFFKALTFPILKRLFRSF
jgi:tRNA (cmo5U34)-methyltransferase